MSYKMSYKVRSLFFFFGFVIAAVVYNGVEEQLLISKVENLEKGKELNTPEMQRLDTDVATTNFTVE